MSPRKNPHDMTSGSKSRVQNLTLRILLLDSDCEGLFLIVCCLLSVVCCLIDLGSAETVSYQVWKLPHLPMK